MGHLIASALAGIDVRLPRCILLGCIAAALLAGCSVLPARRALGPTSTALPPTPTPVPVVAISGTGAYLSRHFVAPFAGWTASWMYQCSAPHGVDWRISIVVHHTRAVLRPHSDVVVHASGAGARSAHGTTVMSTKGNLYAAVIASARCRSTLVGRQP